jgi:hypothetical protein
MKKLNLIVLMTFFIYSCAHRIDRGSPIAITINSMVNQDIDVQKYNNCYIKTFDENALQAKSFSKIISKDLEAYGINVVSKESNANCIIELKYGISTPQKNTYNQPIWGKTGISSINTTSLGSYSGYGSATTYGNMTTGNIYGTSMTSSHSTVNYDYGITGYVPVEYTTYVRMLSLEAETKNKTPLWNVISSSQGSSGDLRYIFPYMSTVSGLFAKVDTKGQQTVSIYANELNYSYYKYGDSLFRFDENEHLYEEYRFNAGGWGEMSSRDIYDQIEEIKSKGQKISISGANQFIKNAIQRN